MTVAAGHSGFGAARVFSRAAAASACLIGGAVLIGWALDVIFLKSIFHAWTTMQANTAACFLLAGVSTLLLERENAPPQSRWLGRCLATIVLMTALLTLAEHLLGWNLRMDQFLFLDRAADSAYPGRMGISAALSFVMLGCSLLLLDVEAGDGHPSQICAIAAIAISLTSLYGHFFGRPYYGTALPIVLTLAALGLGVLLARPSRGLMAIATSNRGAGILIRRLLPVGLVVFGVLGWLRVNSIAAGIVSDELGEALFVTVRIFVFALLIWFTAREVDRAEAKQAQAEEALRRSEENYRLLFENNPLPVWIYDLDSLRFVDVNQTAIRQYGYSKEEFLSMTIQDLRPAEDSPALLESVPRVTPEDEFQGEWAHRKKDGSIITVIITSHGLARDHRRARLVVALDVTRRKLAEQALEESEARFRSVVETARDAIVSANGEGKIIYFNGSAERIFGYSAGEVQGEPLQVIVPEFHAAHDAGFDRFLRMGEARGIGQAVELAGRRKDGSEFPLQLSLADWTLGDAKYFTAVLSDISERVEAERQILERTAQLETANKELETFSYSVSHDLRAPLRGIDGFSEILLREYADKLDETGQDYLRRVRAASQRMAVLIDDLLTLSRVTRAAMRRESVDLTALGEAVIAELRKAEPDRCVEFVAAPQLVAEGDARLLMLVLENLLGNSWKFTSKHPRSRIELGMIPTANRPAYFVRDDGAGFDPGGKDRLFGAFQRLHRISEFPGTGIGLATVQRIIHRHGGEVWAEGRVEQGATFYFTVT
jgi:PAS domain S-box-containing protein